MKLKMVSLFAGVGGFDLAFGRTGMVETVLMSELDKYAQMVLKHHWSEVSLIAEVRDVTTQSIQQRSIQPIDIMVGGFPCQDVSMAGRRTGLVGKRSGLWFEYLRLIRELRPRWVVIENVPGLLSSRSGRDFAVILQGLVECGYRVAYRVLDAQFYGVPQRRRRVFIVASLGNGRCAEVLFEPQGGPRHLEPRRTKGQKVARTIGVQPATSSWVGYDNLIPYRKLRHDGYTEDEVGSTLKTLSRKNDVSDLIVQAVDVRNLQLQPDGVSGTLSAKSTGGYSLNYQNPVIFQQNGSEDVRLMNGDGQIAGALTADPGVKQQNYLSMGYAIRRLTPLECERLQGFPDGWTAVNGMSDTQRYKQMGNAVAVPVVEWIAYRLLAAEQRQRMILGQPLLYPLLKALLAA